MVDTSSPSMICTSSSSYFGVTSRLIDITASWPTMSKRPSLATPNPVHPPVGTLIDGDSLKLVAVLGVGGYGVVYRAVETFSPSQRSYAVKCLSTAGQSSSRRQLHLREITLHQIASAHPSVVTLHRVIEDLNYTYIIMDYAPDEDLFTQILNKTRYLGDNALIKHVFLQLLEAVRYCHSLGIYHRDLKPENILCFERGLKVAITDFGLATTDKLSKEFRTGSVYHMSPECQAGDSENPVPYSPMHNDIWSLGVILLNLVTGRNPWKAAVMDDPTYMAYQRDPSQFLLGVLPISDEFNKILIQVLHVDWKKRMSLDKLRDQIFNIKNFYSDNVIFEGSLARCPWEAGLDLGNGAAQQQQQPLRPNLPEQKRAVPKVPENVEPYCVFSMSDYTSQAPDSDEAMEDSARGIGYFEFGYGDGMDVHEEGARTPYETSGRSTYTPESSSPATPDSIEFKDCGFDRGALYEQDRYYDAESESSIFNNTSTTDSTDDNRFASSVFLATPMVESKPFPFHRQEPIYMEGYRTQKRYSSPNTSVYSVAECSEDTSEQFPPNSPNYLVWPPAYEQPKAAPRGGATRPIDIHHPQGGRGPSTNKLNKSKPQASSGTGLFGGLRFFPRSSGTSWLNSKSTAHPTVPPQKPTAHGAVAARMHPVSTPQVPAVHWAEYNAYTPLPHQGHHARPAANAGNTAYYSGRAFGPHLRSTRDWISG